MTDETTPKPDLLAEAVATYRAAVKKASERQFSGAGAPEAILAGATLANTVDAIPGIEVRDEPVARVVTTAEELDALPLATYWICGCGYHGAKGGNDRYVLLSGKTLTREELIEDHLPLTILYTPKETP